MKNIFIALGIVFATCLAANADEGMIAIGLKKEQSVNENECVQECPKPCKTKCCPTPPAPICTESYLPSYYDLQCDAGMFIYGDFLYWFANEDNLSPCMTVRGSNTSVVENGATTTAPVAYDTLALVSVNHLESKWDPGFRVGLGFNLKDGWDLEVNYTWYHNKKQNTFSVPGFGIPETGITFGNPLFPSPGQLALVDPWINTTVYDFFFPYGPFLFDKVSAQWKLRFNQIDFDLGNKFWIKKSMAVRLFAGARGAWVTSNFINVASSFAGDPIATTKLNSYVHNSFSDQFKDRIWGVGIIGGMQPEWHFCRNFIFFSSLDASLLWGKIKIRKNEDYTSFGGAGSETINYHNSSFSNFMKMQAILDLALGLRWEGTWCYRVRTTLDIGWENHIWFDTNNCYKLDGSHYSGFKVNTGRVVTIYPPTINFQSYEEAQGNLMFGGGFVRFRIDY